jgi:hypothetical protein
VDSARAAKLKVRIVNCRAITSATLRLLLLLLLLPHLLLKLLLTIAINTLQVLIKIPNFHPTRRRILFHFPHAAPDGNPPRL